MTKHQEKTRRLLVKYANAVISHSWKGSGDPADYDAIEQKVKRTRDALLKHVDGVDPDA